MEFLQKIWTNFKARPDFWFFYGFLITAVLSVRKVLIFYPLAGQFNEYTGIYLYLSDILLILALLVYTYRILSNNSFNLSNVYSRLQIRLTSVPRETLILLPLLLVAWSFFSLLWADNKNLALFKSLKLAEFYALYLYAIINVSRGTFAKRFLQIVIGLGVIESILAIWQFVVQHSIGLTWLRESQIGPEIPGVAKLILDGHKIIRAYGTFPHPNILGGFLLFSILTSYLYAKIFHVEHKTSQVMTSDRKMTFFRLFLKSSIFLNIQILALITTFSKSAILGLLIAMTYLFIHDVSQQTDLGSIFRKAKTTAGKIYQQVKLMFHVEHMWQLAFLIIAFSLILALVIVLDKNSALFKSLNERLFYLNVSRETISVHPLLGIGSGQFVWSMQYLNQLIQPWQYQPVHNVFLLVWAELGVVGLAILVVFLWRLLHIEQKLEAPGVKCSTWNNGCKAYDPLRQNNPKRSVFLDNLKSSQILKGLILAFIFIMLFDHYLWDIQQGQVLLWLTLALAAGSAKSTKKLQP